VDVPVLVAGAGPVGLSLACELERHGVAHRIVDAAPERAAGSRATDAHVEGRVYLPAALAGSDAIEVVLGGEEGRTVADSGDRGAGDHQPDEVRGRREHQPDEAGRERSTKPPAWATVGGAPRRTTSWAAQDVASMTALMRPIRARFSPQRMSSVYVRYP